MPKNLPRLILSLSGALLIIAGLVLVYLQFNAEVFGQSPAPTRSLELSPNAGIKLQTTYVGLILVGIGAVLEMVALIGSKTSE